MIVLVNSKVLIPKLFIAKSKKAWYVVSVILLYIITIKVSLYFSEMMFPLLDQETFFAENEHLREPLKGVLEYKWIYPFGFGSVFILLTIIISTILTVSEYDNKRKEKETKLKEEKMEAELKFLRSQINPHFLFNALNNIYSLSYMNMPTAPDKIAQLSEMLRYLLYDCNEERVELSKEISYLHNYIDFQQMKTEDNQNIHFDIDVKNNNRLISPVLLEPFVENAFKYSRLEEEDDEGYVKIKLSENDQSLNFCVINSKSKNTAKNNDPTKGGIGIKNVQKRLKLIYPNTHQLTISEEKEHFEVKLVIHFNA
ncbi:histidine kinase [Flammeovirga sp. MY04]|uniref:sensor histidine kinase n=1 Tax=Flammeovirga sp. MY04 TaxID=1191459 RepID=UPI000824A522|nr:histidine kinase [Flammeovirga sp. MY04]ANQ47987.2 histidine kinase [Flammeovirga sp. MY04]